MSGVRHGLPRRRVGRLAFQYNRGIAAAKAIVVADEHIGFGAARRVGNIIQLDTTFAHRIESQCGRDESPLRHADDKGRFNDAAGTKCVTKN